jgi:dTDP-4-amino-4,6-dideoxygalactose transaminase
MAQAPCRSNLAIDGAAPVRRRPFPGWPQFSESDLAAATGVIRSGRVNYWTGSQGRTFEREFAAACDRRYAVALANGSVALELALRALKIGPGDEVITSSRTFIASASCIAMCGATPVFADVDSNTQNITAATIASMLTPRTRAIVCVHLAGLPCEMDSILQLAREKHLRVIEDCAQAQGARYRGKPVGSFGIAAAFSFCQDKIMTTVGEGGMLVTSEEEIWKRAAAFKDHGSRTCQPDNKEQAVGFRWIHDSIGTNWRMTEVQAAVGRSQLRRVEEWLARRRRHAKQLTERLAHLPSLRIPILEQQFEHAFYRYYVFLEPQKLKSGWDRDRILRAIQAEGIPCFSGSCSEVYMEKAFEKTRPAQRHRIARELGETSLAFLVHPTLEPDDIEDACLAVEKVLRAAAV